MALPLNAIPKPIASYTTTLASKILSTDTSLTVETATDDASGSISGVVGLTCEGEFMIGTKSGTSITGLLRGINPQDGTTEVSSLKSDHGRGAVIKITDAPFLAIVYRLLNGDEGFPNKIKYPSSQTPTLGQYHIVDWDYIKNYADALAIAGAPDASQITKGIVENATTAQVTAGTSAGETSALLFATPAQLAAQIQTNSWLYAVEDGTGSDDTYTASLTPAPSAYTSGMMAWVKITVANTGACTLNLSSLGAKNIKKYASGAKADLETGDIVANMTCLFYYDGTDMVLVNPSAAMPSTAILSEMATFFAGTDMTPTEAETLTSGSANADALHLHEESAQDATRAYFDIMIDEDTTLTDSLSSGSHSRGTPDSSVNSNAATGAITRLDRGNLPSDWADFQNMSVVMKADVTACDAFLGMGNSVGANGVDAFDIQENSVLTRRHVAFLFEDSTVYASVADGTTQTKSSALTGFTYNASTYNKYSIIYAPGTSAKFYVNGVLKATLTTNLPNSGTTDYCLFRVGIEGDAAGKSISYSQVKISILAPVS